MSNEARIISNLTIRVLDGNNNVLLDYQSRPTDFRADVSEARGPTPGLILATEEGTDADLSLLGTPGLAFFWNMDDTNYVTYGRWDDTNSVFYPFGELLAKEGVVLRLSRDVETEYAGTGTAEGGDTTTLRFKSNGGSCYVRVEVFEK